jgi:hypothetical protein
LQQLAARLIERLGCPMSRGSFFGPEYRRLSLQECAALLKGLDEQGVDLDELVKQIDAWPYQNIALDWLNEPERHTYFTIRAIWRRASTPLTKPNLFASASIEIFFLSSVRLFPTMPACG